MVRRVLILGGGFAGLYAARNIQKLMGHDVEIFCLKLLAVQFLQ